MLYLTRVFLHGGKSKVFKHLFVSTQQFSSTVHNTTDHTKCLTSCAELSAILNNSQMSPQYQVLDATGKDGVTNKQDHFNKRIPGSKFFDLCECRDHNSPYPFMLPSPQQFADYVGGLGVENHHHVVIYEDFKDFLMIPSARLWWMFRVFGHHNVSILNGGLKAWIDAGNAVASGEYHDRDVKGGFEASYRPELVATFEQVKKNYVEGGNGVLLEARDGVHMGIEGNQGDISGKSVPGAVWTPFSALLNSQENSVRTHEEILEYMSLKGVDLNDELVSTCEVGFTASSLSFCLYYACGKDVPVYDGSFSEWINRVPPQSKLE